MLIAILPTSLSFYALFASATDVRSEGTGRLDVCVYGANQSLFDFLRSALDRVIRRTIEDYEERTSIQTYRTAVGWYLGALRHHDF